MPDTLTPSSGVDPFAQRLQEALRGARQNGLAAEKPRTRPLPSAQNYGGQCRDDVSCTPVGVGDFVVGESDCLSSIARQTGRLWQTIWNDPANAELREARKDPNVLLAGDRLTIPALRQRSEPGQTEMRHRFVRIGQPTVFQLRLAHNGQPLANRTYTIRFDKGEEFAGTTNSDGFMRCPMPSDAVHGHLSVEPDAAAPDAARREYKLYFGKLEPIDSLIGVQQRLRNLGFYDGANTDHVDERTRSAIRKYQHVRKLAATGAPDADTRKRLQHEHGS